MPSAPSLPLPSPLPAAPPLSTALSYAPAATTALPGLLLSPTASAALPGALLPGIRAEDATLEATVEIKPLDSETSKALKAAGGSLELDKLIKHLERFKNRVSTRHRAVRHLFSLGTANWRTLEYQPGTTKLPGTDLTVADMHVANRWVADAFLNCLDHASDRAANFESDLSPSEMTDGLAMLEKAADLCETRLGAMRMDAEDIFLKCHPFELGASVDATKKAANELLSKFARTPAAIAAATDHIAVRRMLILKVPTTTKNLKEKVNEWEQKLLEAEVLFKSQPARLLFPGI